MTIQRFILQVSLRGITLVLGNSILDSPKVSYKEVTTKKGHKIAKSVGTALLALGLAAGTAGTAMAAVVSAGGGTWDYGIQNLLPGMNWSNYYHSSRAHGSSVEGDVGLVRSPNMAAGYWSYASAWDSNIFRIDRAYWRYA